MQGVGLGIGAQAWQFATSNIVGAIQSAIDAAREEEQSIQKLGSALKANIPAWDGNTKAIEATVAARMKLGFSDDEQRDSLARLVTATHDVTKALDIQRTAMDLARLRGIDLASASDILTKVYAGNIGILSRYGIIVKKGSSATEALAQIQRAAAGQAEDFANTNTGKLVVSQVAVNEAMEKFGTAILPLVAEASSTAAEKITDVTSILDQLNRVQLPGADSGLTDLAANFAGLLDFNPFRIVGDSVDTMLDKLDEFGVDTTKVRDIYADFGVKTTKTTDEVTTAVEGMRGSIDWAAGGAAASFSDVGDEAKDMAKEVKTASQRSASYFKTMKESILEDTGQLIDSGLDPIQAALDATSAHYRVHEGIVSRASAKTKEDVNSAKSDIVDALDDEGQSLLDLGKHGKLTAKQVDRFASDTKAAFKALGLKVPKDIQKVLDKLYELAGYDNKHINVSVSTHLSGGGKAGAHKRAFGGPVKADNVYTVGEKGPELFVPDTNGTIVPNDKLHGRAGALGGADRLDIYINVVGTGVLSPAHGQAIAREIGPYIRDYANRRG